jgi:hypothetical protein
LTGVLIGAFSLVPTMRGLYLLAFVMMTIKFFATNALVVETAQGLERMQATRRQSIFVIVRESQSIFRQILRAPDTLVVSGLMAVVGISTIINTTFWSIFVTESLQVAPEYLSLYYVARSISMLLFYILVMPKLRTLDVRRPMVFGFAGFILSWIILISIPPRSYLWLLASVILEGCSIPATSTLLDKLIAISVNPQERARIMALLFTTMLLLTSPFGWVAGQLSEINRSLPFVLNIVLFIAGGLLAYLASRRTAPSNLPPH